jgi:3(or 17)beta-hydroxysteroid dehydrogenase
MGRIQGKTAIVTGGVRGLGAATVRMLTGEGAKVVIAGGREVDGLELEHELRAAGASVTYVALDVREGGQWSRVVESAMQLGGSIDVLVNNAGLSSNALHADRPDPLDPVVWDALLRVNLDGAFNGCRAVIPHMVEAGSGSIVNVASIAGVAGLVEVIPPYSASKAGLAGLTRSLAVRYGPDGVRVNTVNPGLMPPMRGSARRSELTNVGEIPLRRISTFEEVASAVLFLAADESSYITGVTLNVDGGATVQIRTMKTPALP